MARVLIGTSGWNYAGWKGLFYPPKLPSRRFLEFYAQEFKTAEVNYSFYHLPKQDTYKNWAAQVPDQFAFAVKVSRFISHVKRLSDIEDAWRVFVDNALALGAHLGPMLLQFPPSFHRLDERVESFLNLVKSTAKIEPPLQLAFEFRHQSWFEEDIYRLLRKYNAALCIADSPRYPRKDVVTADFAYFRYHGRTDLFASCYSDDELSEEARKIRKLLDDGVDVYAYFNNDMYGHAIRNARTLVNLLS